MHAMAIIYLTRRFAGYEEYKPRRTTYEDEQLFSYSPHDDPEIVVSLKDMTQEERSRAAILTSKDGARYRFEDNGPDDVIFRAIFSNKKDQQKAYRWLFYGEGDEPA